MHRDHSRTQLIVTLKGRGQKRYTTCKELYLMRSTTGTSLHVCFRQCSHPKSTHVYHFPTAFPSEEAIVYHPRQRTIS